jgi:hypothetical protein
MRRRSTSPKIRDSLELVLHLLDGAIEGGGLMEDVGIAPAEQRPVCWVRS